MKASLILMLTLIPTFAAAQSDIQPAPAPVPLKQQLLEQEQRAHDADQALLEQENRALAAERANEQATIQNHTLQAAVDRLAAQRDEIAAERDDLRDQLKALQQQLVDMTALRDNAADEIRRLTAHDPAGPAPTAVTAGGTPH